MSGPIKVLVVEREPMRLGIGMALSGPACVCVEAGTAEEAVTVAASEQPRLCLIGREFVGERMAVVGSILSFSPRTAIVVLGGVRSSVSMLDAVRAGAAGYLPGELDVAGLRRVVAAVAKGQAIIPRSMVHELLLELRTHEEELTRRELQVLSMLRRGLSTAAIAERLEIAPVTVRRHISELRRKLGVANRSELIAAARGPQTSPRRTA